MSEFVTKQIVVAQVLVTKLRERAEEGQSMVEYSLVIAFISIVAIAALTHLGQGSVRVLRRRGVPRTASASLSRLLVRQLCGRLLHGRGS
jgi:Flp pilus assembly pilin Flp